MSALIKGIGIACVLAVLTGCVSLPRRVETKAAWALQNEREERLRQIENWSLSGRVAVASGRENGSGRLEWKQSGEQLEIRLSAPVSRQSWRLVAGPRYATLEGFEKGVLKGNNADALLAEATGWPVPLEQWHAWSRGMRYSSRAQIEFGADNLPRLIRQNGWEVEYRDWYTDRTPAVPRRIFAHRGDTRVRLVVDRWDMPPNGE